MDMAISTWSTPCSPANNFCFLFSWANEKRDSAPLTTGTPPPPTKPSTGRAPADYWIPWPELLRRTIGVDPEICHCGAKMTVDDAITEAEKITETLARLGIESTGPPEAMRSIGELDYIYDC